MLRSLRQFALFGLVSKASFPGGHLSACEQLGLFDPVIPINAPFKAAEIAVDFCNLLLAPLGDLVEARDTQRVTKVA